MTTNKNTNTATMIDENRFFKCVAPFLFSHSQVIPEMIENAIRAKSSSVKIQTKDLDFVLENDGKVLEDFSNLFIVAQSSYDIDVENAQKPAGMGILSIIASSTVITFASGNKEITVNSDLYFNDADYRANLLSSIVETKEAVSGMKITATLKKSVDKFLTTKLDEEFRYYNIDIIYNEERIKTKKEIPLLFSKEISKGVVVGISQGNIGFNHYYSRNTDGYVIWHGKLISAPQIKPFTLIVNGETDLVTPVLPNRSAITLGNNEGKELSQYFESFLSEEIQQYIDSNDRFDRLQNVLYCLSDSYNLDNINTYFNCKKFDEDSIYFDSKETVKIKINEDIQENDAPLIFGTDIFKFVPLMIGKTYAPKWVSEKIQECFIEVEVSEKAQKAYSYYEYRDEFNIADSIKVNGIEVDGILDDCCNTLYFTPNFDTHSFIDEYCDRYAGEYQSSDECYEEMEEDFRAILQAYQDNVNVNLEYKLHNAIKNIAEKQQISAASIDKIQIIKDENGGWKLCILSGDETLGEFEAFNIHNVR